MKTPEGARPPLTANDGPRRIGTHNSFPLVLLLSQEEKPRGKHRTAKSQVAWYPTIAHRGIYQTLTHPLAVEFPTFVC